MLRFIDTGINDGYINMAIDEALGYCFDNNSYPTLRFYGWTRPSISIGYFQKMNEVKKIFTGYCITNSHSDRVRDNPPCSNSARPASGVTAQLRAAGVPDPGQYAFVRRPTGGGAVVHNGNTTISVIFKREDKPVDYYYRLVSEAIINCAQYLCPSVSFNLCSSVSFCHNNITRYDVIVDGAKLAGFAGRRFRYSYLLQAYIDIGYNIFLKDALTSSFEKVLGLEVFTDALSQQEMAYSLRLEGKYRSKGWNYKR